MEVGTRRPRLIASSGFRGFDGVPGVGVCMHTASKFICFFLLWGLESSRSLISSPISGGSVGCGGCGIR